MKMNFGNKNNKILASGTEFLFKNGMRPEHGQNSAKRKAEMCNKNTK